MVWPGRGLRRRRRRADGGDEPADPDTAERPGGRHDADREADGGEAAARRPPRQLRPADLLELPGEPAGRARSQHHSGSAFGLGLCIDRQRQLRVDDPHPRTGRPRHRPAVLGDARPAQSPRGRDRARVLPRAAADRRRRSFDDFTPDPRRVRLPTPFWPVATAPISTTPRIPFDPGPRPALDAGHTASWFFGESLEPDTATLVLEHPGQPRNAGPLRGVVARTGRPAGALPSPCPWVRARGDRPSSGRRRHRAVGPGAGRLTPVTAGGRSRWPDTPTSWPAHCRRRWCRDRGNWPASLRAMPCSPSASRRSPSSPSTATWPAAAGAGAFEHDEVRTDPRAGACAVDGDPFGRVGLGVERNRLGRRRQGPGHPASMTSISSSRCMSRPATMWSRSTTGRATSCWPASSASAPSCLLVALLAAWVTRRLRRRQSGAGAGSRHNDGSDSGRLAGGDARTAWAELRSRTAVQQKGWAKGQEELPVVGAPHPLDHEAGVGRARARHVQG